MSDTDVSEATEATTPTGGGRPSTLVLWFALASGITAWMIHLVGGGALVPTVCAHDVPWVIDALTAGTGAVCVAGAVVSWRIMHRFEGRDDSQALGFRTLGLIALISNLGSLALVVGEGLMHGWIGVCR